MTPEDMDIFLDLRQGTSRLALSGLHSVLKVPSIQPIVGDKVSVEALHASLSDYLGDARRSGPWCISMPWLYFDYLYCTIRLLSLPPTDSIGYLKK